MNHVMHVKDEVIMYVYFLISLVGRGKKQKKMKRESKTFCSQLSTFWCFYLFWIWPFVDKNSSLISKGEGLLASFSVFSTGSYHNSSLHIYLFADPL